MKAQNSNVSCCRSVFKAETITGKNGQNPSNFRDVFTKSNFFFRHFPPKRVCYAFVVCSSSPWPAHRTGEAILIHCAQVMEGRPSFIISTFNSSLKTCLFKRCFISQVLQLYHFIFFFYCEELQNFSLQRHINTFLQQKHMSRSYFIYYLLFITGTRSR